MSVFIPRLSCAAMATAVFILLLLAFPSQVNAQKWPDPLTPDEVSNLTHKARMLYLDAVKDFDHVLYDAGVKKLEECAGVDKDNIALQFYQARVERLQALKKRGAEAKACYDAAIASLERIVKNPVASEEDSARAAELIKDMKRYKDGVDDRDKRIAAVGQAIQRQIASDLAKATEEAAKKTATTSDAAGGGGAAGAGGGGGASSMGGGAGGGGGEGMGPGGNNQQQRPQARSQRGGGGGGKRGRG
ncbi:MAG: hypothetical protein NTX50_14550 [Candidatus Sumerlaeota bacterium]|nr:hypothetical protein [Candidatus Sumerlaeota bacterium]